MNPMDTTREEVGEVFSDGGSCQDCPEFFWAYEPDGEGGVMPYRACKVLDVNEDYESCQGLTSENK